MAAAPVAYVPWGALEWHGPHLPFGTDVILASEFAARIRGTFSAVLFPAMPYSACPGKTSGYEGTIAIRPEIALAYLCDVLAGIVDSGFERVLLMNGHDANMSMARAAMEWVSGQRRASFLLVNWFQLLTPAEVAATTPARSESRCNPWTSLTIWAPEAIACRAVDAR